MKKAPITTDDLRGVFAVPPLGRRIDAQRSIDFQQNDLIIMHIREGGITRFIYGGNAFLYHITLSEYEQLLEWLSSFADDVWAIPSIGPAYGRAMDQAAVLRRYRFPCAMMLPCGDPSDATGLEQGYREIAEAASTKLIIYLKDESNFGPDKSTGLDVVARLVEEEICVGIKYAVVHTDPARDAYLESLLQRVDRRVVISGIGERPAVNHLRDWKLPGFTTGSGCVAPRLSQSLFAACEREDFETAELLRSDFLPLEDLRDAWGPAKVLHESIQLAGIARTGPVAPYVSGLSAEQKDRVAPVALDLLKRNSFVSRTTAANETHEAH